MTGEFRNHLRLQRDRKMRERLRITATGRRQRRAESVSDCGGCGGGKDLWTVGCDVCINRHKKRAQKAVRYGHAKPTVEKVFRCRVCCGVLPGRGADCESCREAQTLGLERVARQSERRCVGCDTELDNCTSGCEACTDRRRKRVRDQKTEAVATSLRESATASDNRKVPV